MTESLYSCYRDVSFYIMFLFASLVDLLTMRNWEDSLFILSYSIHERPCLITFPNIEKRERNMMHSGVFLMTLKIFGDVIKYHLWVFDICFWSKLKLTRKWRNKMVKMYANWDQTSKHWHVHWLPLFKLDELLRCLSGYMNGVLVYTGSKKMPFCISIFHPSCLLGIWFMRYLRQIKVDHQVP